MSHLNSIKLSELTRKIEQVVQEGFAHQTFWVRAELSGVKYYPLKEQYFFTLVEKQESTHSVLTSISSKAWGSAVEKIRTFEQSTGQQFSNDIQVLVLVTVQYHITYGLQLNLLDIDPAFTIGNLELQRQLTLQKLVANNPEHVECIDGQYRSYNQKLKVPGVLQYLALITSENSDGYKDFKHELLHNPHGYYFKLEEYFTPVQGEGVERLMVERFIEIFQSQKKYDAVVLVRGGGATADFVVYDTYALARVVARFPIPVITGIGHTRNETLVDLMACLPTKTPTKAAEIIVYHNRIFEQQVEHLQVKIIRQTREMFTHHQLVLNENNSRIHTRSQGLVVRQRQILSSLNFQLVQVSRHAISRASERLSLLSHSLEPKIFLRLTLQRLSLIRLRDDLEQAAPRLLQKKQQQLHEFIRMVRHLSPSNVLKRGYALLIQHGKIVTDPEGI
ncbi:MAG: exodeoxyribonuclease VII large subunit, partial [Chitinophagaceae bacterium]